MDDRALASRRRFLQFLCASPLFGSAAIAGLWESRSALAADLAAVDDVTTAAQALNVFDLERIAILKMPIAHGAYLATGVEGDATIQANRDGFRRFQVRARRLVNTTRIDMGTTLFGTPFAAPIFTCPVSSLNAFQPGGDVMVGCATAARKQLQVYPTLANSTLREVSEGRGGVPPWFQLYPTREWTVTQALVKRADSAGCPVLVVTVDNPTAAGRETLARRRRLDARTCTDCHSNEPGAAFRRKSMFEGLDMSKVTSSLSDHLSWDFVKRLRDVTSMKIVLKGIVTSEDAALALEHGADGIYVSNHGGRSEESLRSTIEALPEVVETVRGRVPVLIDSGFRRGSDIFKALALGADAVGVGRPYVWGLAAFAQEGVDRALDILKSELEVTMRSMGAPSIASMRRGFVVRT